MVWQIMAGNDDFLTRFRVIRRGVLLWAVWLVTITVLAYLENIGKVQVTDGVIIGAIVGILSVVIEFQTREK